MVFYSANIHPWCSRSKLVHMACYFRVSSSQATAQALWALGKSPWALVSCARTERAQKGLSLESFFSLFVDSLSHQLIESGTLTSWWPRQSEEQCQERVPGKLSVGMELSRVTSRSRAAAATPARRAVARCLRLLSKLIFTLSRAAWSLLGSLRRLCPRSLWLPKGLESSWSMKIPKEWGRRRVSLVLWRWQSSPARIRWIKTQSCHFRSPLRRERTRAPPRPTPKAFWTLSCWEMLRNVMSSSPVATGLGISTKRKCPHLLGRSNCFFLQGSQTWREKKWRVLRRPPERRRWEGQGEVGLHTDQDVFEKPMWRFPS